MIFLALGTQKFQFNRILKSIDNQIANGLINDNVVAQIGHSTYLPKNYKYYRFIDSNDFDKYLRGCSILITHGGVGTILQAKRRDKPVIVVPRLVKFSEHVDNHQLEIAREFSNKNYVYYCENCDELNLAIKKVKKTNLKKYCFNNKKFVNSFFKILEYM
ncbi:glycosyltransferase [Limosilactobacillus reuteri]|uniref:PssE/Cps14G family polysaccharide biosynthesis glycosyltransferase n=1 Tax=Limosilactobacillus reuteri TaxID=1598 RepID=UPI002362E77B|nr:PssE/Cps14G family polysaccharide biosynthesis glycosyltransferase [Limosilactobacillus reuteri]MDD1406668.1 glycosyltransferase [Limosilactobacillus reuteri]